MLIIFPLFSSLPVGSSSGLLRSSSSVLHLRGFTLVLLGVWVTTRALVVVAVHAELNHLRDKRTTRHQSSRTQTFGHVDPPQADVGVAWRLKERPRRPPENASTWLKDPRGSSRGRAEECCCGGERMNTCSESTSRSCQLWSRKRAITTGCKINSGAP